MINIKLDLQDSIPGTKEIIRHWGIVALKEHLILNHEYEVNSDKVVNLLGKLSNEYCHSNALTLNNSSSHTMEDLFDNLPKDLPLIKNKNLESNLIWLQKKFELCDAEIQFLTLVFLAYKDPIFKSLLGEFSRIMSSEFIRVVSKLINLSEKKLKSLLQKESKLIQLGFITVNSIDEGGFYTRLGMLDYLIDHLSEEELNCSHFHSDFLKAPVPELSIDDFPQMEDEIDDLKIFLRQACLDGIPGINVLIHGQEGIGKTQFVRALVDHLQLSLFEICAKSSISRQPANPLQQIFRVQQLLSNEHNNMLLVDNAHDLYETLSTETISFTNRLPIIWLTNQPDVFNFWDLHKFSYFLEVKKPTRTMRYDFLKSKMQGFELTDPWINKTVMKENIPFSILDGVANFTKTVCKNENSKSVEKVFDKALLRTEEFFRFPQKVSNIFDTHNYNKDFINSDVDLGIISESLRCHSEARICLAGPPGCGKTGYAYYLAHILDKQIITKKGSDILGRYIGDTEQNLASSFLEAKSLDAILLIDEVDGLLLNRQDSQRSWEISMVNELLTQIDSFKGLLVVTTNLFNKIDPAAMRRFDLKVKFDYLNANQIGQIWDKQVNYFCLINDNKARHELMAMKDLTPGDFANIERQSKFMPLKDAKDLISRLRKEASFKHERGVSKAIGFLI